MIVRGARQVGKTWLVRELGKSFEDFIEFNFERTPELDALFARGLEPKRIVQELSAVAKKRIKTGKTLVFLDEIQQSLSAIKSIRYFYEELPKLHLVVAGSLLNMVLDKIPTGVGRVTYLDLYPMSFGEFIEAADESILRKMIVDQTLSEPLMDVHHQKLLEYVRMYMLLGGMPAVLESYFSQGDILACQQIQEDLLRSFADDFRKYANQSDIQYLMSVFRSVPVQLGKKFKYVTVDASVKSRYLSNAINLLEMAGLVHKVYHSSADGIPIVSRIRTNRFKVIFFDTGLAQRLLKADLKDWLTTVDIETINSGAIAEQFVGQELATLQSANPLNPLTFWHREARNSNAEVDYLIELGLSILPIEVKAGTKGGMKSLHLFLKEKKLNRAIKISKPMISDDGKIISLPFYALEKLHSFVGSPQP